MRIHVCVCIWVLTRYIHVSYYKIERQNFRTGPRIAPKFGTHVPIDTLTLKTLKKWTHPRGVKRAYTCVNDVAIMFVLAEVVFLWLLYTLHLLILGHDRRTAPKFGTHVRIDTLTIKKKIDPPRGGLGGYILLKIFRHGSRPNLARICG